MRRAVCGETQKQRVLVGSARALLWLFPNQPGVHLSSPRKASPDRGHGEGKESVLQVPSREPGSWRSRSPKSPTAFKERFLKTKGGRGVAGRVISSWTFF